MSNLKSVLKEARRLIVDEKRNEEAMELCEKYIDEGVRDYMLYCFAAKANSNQNYPIDASAHYLEAVKLDPEKPTAWQGLFELYDSLGLKIDEKAIETADRIIAIADSEEKRKRALIRRREFLLKLRKFSELEADIGDDLDFLKEVVSVIMNRETRSETEKRVLSLCFAVLKDGFSQDAGLHFLFVKNEVEKSVSHEDWQNFVEDYCRQHGATDSFILERVEVLLCLSALKDNAFTEELFLAYEDVAENEDNFSYQLLSALAERDLSEAADLVEGLSDSGLLSIPIVYAAIRVLFEDENYERCLRAISWAETRCSDKTVLSLLNGLKGNCLLCIGDLESLRLGCLLCPLPKRFALVDFLLRLKNGDAVDPTSLQNDIDAARATVAVHLRDNTFAAAASAAQSLAGSEACADLVLRAEALLLSGGDATALLVGAAKENPRCSRAFYLLARALKKKNAVKARSCAERAVKIRGQNEEYVRLLDDILLESDTAANERVSVLCSLNRRPDWVRKRLPALFLAVGKNDEAVAELQHLLRSDASDADVWCALAGAYAHRGSLQASVNAYSQAAELRPESDFIIPMLQVLLRMGQLDAVIEKCAVWRETRAMETTRAPAHTAVDLLDAQARFGRAKETIGEERIGFLNSLFALLAPLLDIRPSIGILYKLSADALLFVTGFNAEIFPRIKLPDPLPSSLTSVWPFICSLYAAVLSLHRELPSAWADLGIALAQRASAESCITYADKSIDCLKQAIRLTIDPIQRSLFWTKLSDAVRVAGKGADIQQHCLIRALQLNRSNAEAWCRLGILYAKFGPVQRANARYAVESGALKVNPESAVAWTCYGMLAMADAAEASSTDSRKYFIKNATEMFAQALTFSPTELAVENLCDLLSASGRSFDSSASRVDFERVLALFDRSDRQVSFALRLSILAEYFGFLEEAVSLLEGVLGKEKEIHLQRLHLRMGVLIDSTDPRLAPLTTLARMDTSHLFEELLGRIPSYASLLHSLPTGEGVFDMCKGGRESVLLPLVVAAVIMNDIPLGNESISALHEMRPRHELVDVWPIEIDTDMDNETRFLEQDGEAPFRLRHRIAKGLFEVLSKKREEWLSVNPPQVREEQLQEDELQDVLRESAGVA